MQAAHPQPSPLVSRYDAAAHDWHRKVSRLGYPAAYGELFEGREPAARVLDIGTGSGAMAEAWVDGGLPRELTLLDPSEAMLTEAATRLGRYGVQITRVADGVGTSDVAEGAFGAVLCAHVLEHLPDIEGALRWSRTRLRSGGRFYLVASRPHWCTALLRWVWGHRAFAPDDMVSRLARAGFAEIRTVPFSKGPPSRTSMGYIAMAP